MKSIVTVNTVLPTIENAIEYCSGESLQDYDIVLFDPKLPYASRIDFTGGGSCISIDGGARITSAITHWAEELYGALKAGKTVFIVLNDYESDTVAIGSTLIKKGQRTYSTSPINNYQALPLKVNIKNVKGKKIVISDNFYKGLYDAIKEVAQYRVVINGEIGKKIYTTKDGSLVGTHVRPVDLPGNMVLLPYFNLLESDKGKDNKWTKESLGISTNIVDELLSIDKALKQQDDQTPQPEWIKRIAMPEQILGLDEKVRHIESEISSLEKQKEDELMMKNDLLQFTHLLYENGKNLEIAIEKSLKLFGYSVETYRKGDLEIDHIITGPNNVRMIGESEGRDNSAIDISKFRQLESNINEDFERESVDKPAKGILFGNGYRFTSPDSREEQFTDKCFKNARRLGTALVRTSDLYKAVVCLLNSPNNDTFKQKCREALENTTGEIVIFPDIDAD